MSEFTPKWNRATATFHVDPFGTIAFDDDSILEQNADLITAQEEYNPFTDAYTTPFGAPPMPSIPAPVPFSNPFGNPFAPPPPDPFALGLPDSLDDSLEETSSVPLPPEQRDILDRWLGYLEEDDFKGLRNDVKQVEKEKNAEDCNFLSFWGDTPLLIHLLREAPQPEVLLPNVIFPLGYRYTDSSNRLPSSILLFFIERDDVTSLIDLLDHFQMPTCYYDDFVHYAASHLALDCLRHLFSLDHSYKLTPELYYSWALFGLGALNEDEKVDECARIIAEKFTQEEGGEPTPYPHSVPVYLRDMDYFQLFLGTPFLEYHLHHDILHELLWLPCLEHLSLAFYRELRPGGHIPHDGCKEVSGASHDTISCSPWLHHCCCVSPLYPSKLPHIHYQEIAHFLNALLDKFPHFIKRQKARSLLVALALVDDPCPTILARAQALTGKQLVLDDLDFPWFEPMEGQNTSLLQHSFYCHWTERLPSRLSPVFRYSAFEARHALEGLLTHSRPIGTPPKHYLSTLGEAIFELPEDHPLFDAALAEGGLLHKELNNFLIWLDYKRSTHRSRYLKAISTLEGGNDYEL